MSIAACKIIVQAVDIDWHLCGTGIIPYGVANLIINRNVTQYNSALLYLPLPYMSLPAPYDTVSSLLKLPLPFCDNTVVSPADSTLRKYYTAKLMNRYLTSATGIVAASTPSGRMAYDLNIEAADYGAIGHLGVGSSWIYYTNYGVSTHIILPYQTIPLNNL